MARIKINDLPKDMKISKEDMRKITGGSFCSFESNIPSASDAVSSNASTLADYSSVMQDAISALSGLSGTVALGATKDTSGATRDTSGATKTTEATNTTSEASRPY